MEEGKEGVGCCLQALHGMASSLLNSEQLWLSTQDLHEPGPTNILSQRVEELEVPAIPEDLWEINGYGGGVFFPVVWPLESSSCFFK